MNVREIIDAKPMTRYQWLIIALATLLMATEGYDIQAMAFTANSVMNDLGIGSTEFGYLLSAGFIGIAIGAVSAGPFADKFGRRPVLLGALLVNGLGLFLTATADSVTEVFFWRLLTGLGIGAAMNPISVIVSEYANAKNRALALSVFAAGFSIGGALGGLVSPATINSFGWQGVFALGGIITVMVIVIAFLAIPESITHLATKYTAASGPRVHAQLTRTAARIGMDINEISPQESQPTANAKTGSYGELFRAKYRARTISIWVIALSVMGTFYFVTAWTPQLLTRVGMTEEQGITVGMLLLAGGVVGTLSFGLLSTKWDVRRVSSLFMVASAVLAVVFILSTQYLVGALIMGLVLGVAIGANASIYYALTPMTYPQEIRATGAGAAATVGRLATILAPIAVGYLLDAGIGPSVLFIAVAVALLIGAGMSWNHKLEQKHAQSKIVEDSPAVPEGHDRNAQVQAK